MVFLSLSCMLGVYYYSAYNKYANALGAVTSNQLTWQDKVEIVNNLPKPYGFLEYKENLLFEALPVSSQQLEEKIALGKRVILRHPEPQKLMTFIEPFIQRIFSLSTVKKWRGYGACGH